MKRKLLLTSMLLLLTGLITHAQDLDINPSQQAQGILDSKNAMVDHATGLFHYKVPLYEIKSGSFTLPISLNYVAKGVKVNDQPGLVDYNWTLNTGGVVTRTIRGGIADEDWNGIAHKPLSSPVTVSEIRNVNRKQQDGESDIFTATFNGKSINFIIIYNNIDRSYICESLERTNVQIKCKLDNGYGIDGWIITDDNGDKYIFNQKEWTSNIIREGAAGISMIDNKSYVSSWYINRIEPFNNNPISFYYKADVEKNGIQDNVKITTYNEYNMIKYNYGYPVKEYFLDFENYRLLFASYIDQANLILMHSNIRDYMNNSPTIFEDKYWIPNPNYETNAQQIYINNKVMGILNNYSRTISNTGSAINELKNYIKLYGGHYEMRYYLESALDILIKCATYSNDVYEKEAYISGTHSVLSPLLSRIKCSDGIFMMYYLKDGSNSYFLDKLTQFDNYNNKLKNIKFEISRNNEEDVDNQYNHSHLTKISYLDSQDIEYDNLKFGYCVRQNSDLFTDLWGYNKTRIIYSDPNIKVNQYYLTNVDVNAKMGSLCKIKYHNQNEIELDYESNTIAAGQFDGSKYELPFGGIRIKNIFIKELETRSCDTISYNYQNGMSVYMSCSNKELVGGDYLTHSRIINEGVAYVNCGNNGLYYSTVEEKFSGKGSRVYNFTTPMSGGEFKFWLCALPYSIATYDLNNVLNTLIKYKYYATNDAKPDEILITPNSHYNYDKNIMQLKPGPYYIEPEDVIGKYPDRNIEIYNGGPSFNPFRHIYQYNIVPRLYLSEGSQNYMLKYGGKTLLKEQVEYKFENQSRSTSYYDDLDKVSSFYVKTEYFYDNPAYSIYPTRIITSNSTGEQTVEITKRVTEVTSSTDSVILKMKERNCINPILSSESGVKRSNAVDFKLLKHTVYKYDYDKKDNIENICPKKIYNYTPLTKTNIVMTDANSDIFKYGISEYDIDNCIDYSFVRNKWLPVYTKDKNEEFSLITDFENKKIILKAKNMDANDFVAMDLRKYSFTEEGGYSPTFFVPFFKKLRNFYNKVQALNFDQCPESFYSYIDSYEYRETMDFIRKLFHDDVYSDASNLFEEYLRIYDMSYFTTIESVFENYLSYFTPNNILTSDDIKGLSDSYAFLSAAFNPNYLNLYPLEDTDEISVNPDTLRLENNIQTKKLKLYIISKVPYGYNYSYTVTHALGSTVFKTALISTNYWTINIADIDLSTYSDISKIEFANIYQMEKAIAYIALIPADAEFEATSYNTDGTVFCKFNQNGQLECYEYDAAGRVIKIYDNDNNVLKEFNYNVVLPQ